MLIVCLLRQLILQKKINDNIFYAIVIGEVDVSGLLDDQGLALTSGEYYFLSQSTPGKITSSASTGVIQSVLKVNNANNATISFGEPYVATSGGVQIFTASNNVSSPTSITGFAFSNTNTRAFKSLVSVEIDATNDLYEVFELRGIQKSNSWGLSIVKNGDDSGFVFSITLS